MIEDIVKLKRKGLTLQEIADQMNISLGKVQYRWNKYRHQLSSKPVQDRIEENLEQKDWKMPYEYDEANICLMPISPNSLYAYWSYTNTIIKMTELHFRTDWDTLPKVLKLYDVTDIIFYGHNAHRTFEVELPPMTNNWFVNGIESDRTYVIDFGTRTFDGSFFTLMRSNPAETSPVNNSTMFDQKIERWKAQEVSQPEWLENFSTYSYYQKIK